MKFCNDCNNMLYLTIHEQDANCLQFYCRNCGGIEEQVTAQSICISSLDMTENNSFNYVVNKYTKLDPTLPRVSNILCPNDFCKTNTDSSVKKDVIYIRYDKLNLKFLYLCCNCDHVWKPSK